MMVDHIWLELAETGERSSAQWLLLIAAILIVTFIMLRSNRRRMVEGASRRYKGEMDPATTRSAAIKKDMERLVIELNELAREVNGQIDTRFAKLEQSIADADKRVSALRILVDAANKANDAAYDRIRPPATSSESVAAVSQAGIDVTISDEGETGSAVGGPEKPTVDSSGDEATQPEEPETQEAAGRTSSVDEINSLIYSMADLGHSPIEIAQELEQNVGEVELILNLRPGRGDTERGEC